MPNNITTGVKITVDSSELDVKFLKSVDQLNAGLTKTQRSLKLTYNEQGLLVNSLGQCVEGLSVSQIKLGQYVDIMGRVHTVQGGFIEGLNKSQIAMGQYTDELGNIYNAAGELIGKTEKATKELEKQFKTVNDALNEVKKANEENNNRARESFNGLNNSAKETAETFKKIGEGTPLQPITDAISDTIEKLEYLNNIADTLRKTNDNIKQINNSTNKTGTGFDIATKGARALGRAVGLISKTIGRGGWIAAGIITAGVTLRKITEKPINENWTETFKKIADRAYQAGREVKTLRDGLEFGVGNGQARSQILDVLKEYQTLKETGYTKEERENIEHYKNKNTLGGDIMATLSQAGTEFDHKLGFYNGDLNRTALLEQKQAAIDEINNYIQTIADEQRTARENLELKLKEVLAVKATGELNDKQTEILNKKISQIKEAIKTETLKEIGVNLEKIPTAAETFSERLKKLTELKTSLNDEDFKATQNEIATKYAEQVAKEAKKRAEILDAQETLKEAYKNASISLESYEEANKQLEEASGKLLEAQRRELESKTGAKFNEKSPREELNEKYALLSKALEEETITQEEHNAAKAKLTEQYKKARGEELGVMFERIAEPAEEYQEKQKRLNDLLSDELINVEEHARATAQLKEAAANAIPGLMELIEAGEKQKTAAEEHAETMKRINEALEAGVIDTIQSQKAVKAANERLAEATEREAKEKEQRRKEELDKLGFNNLQRLADAIDEKALTPIKRAQEQFNALTDAYKNKIISEEEYNKAQKNWRKIRTDAAKNEEEKKLKERADQRTKTRSALGVDAVLEGLKTPLEKYRETMKQIEAAAKARDISKEERVALEDKAAETYWDAMKKNEQEKNEQRGTANKFELAKSISGGSEALYLAQVKNSTANYQTRMQASAEQLAQYSGETLYQAQQTNLYLSELVENQGAGYGVWG